LFSDATDAETTLATDLTAFNSNGFTLGAGLGSNANTETFVGWQWKAGVSAVTNTAGSITSTVDAGATQGFSVVTYTGTGANATVGHGLGVAPKMVIVKNRTGGDWKVYNANVGNTYQGFLNDPAAFQGSSPTLWNSTTPTSTVFSIGTNAGVNGSGNAIVAYCFAEVAGYSAFGKYTGNGSTDGPFIFCNFRPRWVMIKQSDAVRGWNIEDTSRSTYNSMILDLDPSSSAAENSNAAWSVDALSNGFKIRTSDTSFNASGGTYIFAAFCENPLKYSLAR
jgi:hypothetical protein